MRAAPSRLFAWMAVVAVPAGLAMSGCASQSMSPRVENCGIVAISSPTRYVCDGKVYTSFELTKLRENGGKKSVQ